MSRAKDQAQQYAELAYRIAKEAAQRTVNERRYRLLNTPLIVGGR